MLFFLAIHVLSCKSVKKPNYECPSTYNNDLKVMVYSYVDKMPRYEGGNSALVKFIANNFVLPKQSQYQASFYIEFIIDTEGKIIDSWIKNKNNSELTACEVEILKTLNKTPNWKAGECNGKKVVVKSFLSIKL